MSKIVRPTVSKPKPESGSALAIIGQIRVNAEACAHADIRDGIVGVVRGNRILELCSELEEAVLMLQLEASQK